MSGAFIHASDPFATPEQARSPVRRLRGRLPTAVTLWTASGPVSDPASGPVLGPASGPAGLTVSSTLVADGEPGRLLGLVDEESALWTAVSATGRFVVAVLGPAHRQLADRFAGVLPAPGGLFAVGRWVDTPYGPVPAGVGTWVGCRLDAARPLGWALLVEASIERVELADDPPLLHYRGRYQELP